jgi:FdhD protein
LVDDPSQVRELRYCVGEEEQQYNVLSARLAAGAPGMAAAGIRNFTTSSSCGLCGKARIDDVIGRRPVDVRADTTKFAADVLSSLPDRLRESQRVFADTGGLHAAGLFEATGHLVCAREDVGRHNAFDKVIGWAGMERRLPLTGHVFVASGRASFELVQKALLAGAPALAAVSAPSSLAVALAEAAGMTLVGFLRHGGMNVYAGDWRVT